MGEIINYLQNQTAEYILSKLKDYVRKAKIYINKIDQYEKTLATTSIQGSWFLPEGKTSQKVIQAEQKVYAQLQKNRRQMLVNNNKIRQVIIDSYVLINHIAELFHEEITYSITLPPTAEGETNITFEMPLSVFVKEAVTVGYATGIRLKKDASALRKQLLASTNKDISIYDWKDQKNEWYNEQNYQDFLYEIKVARQGKVDINFNKQGNQLESFFHWANANVQKRNMASLAKRAHLGQADFDSMVSELEKARVLGLNSRPYWSGGDVANKQIKGADANVTNTQSLKQQLLRFVTIATVLDLSSLEEKINSTKGSINDTCINEVTSKLNGLATTFLKGYSFSKDDVKMLGLNIDNLI